jgi:hypothetical protein
VAAFAADVEKFHSRIIASLLRLEEHGFLVGTDRTWLIRSWKLYPGKDKKNVISQQFSKGMIRRIPKGKT